MRYVAPLLLALFLVACGGSSHATPPVRTTLPRAVPTQATVAAGQLHRAGEAVQVGDLLVRFDGGRYEPVATPDDSGVSDHKDPGTDWLVLAFTVTNTSSHPAQSSQFDVQLGRLVDGHTVYNNVHAPIEIVVGRLHPSLQDKSLQGALAPGESLSGVSVREVLTADPPFVVKWEDIRNAAEWAVLP